MNGARFEYTFDFDASSAEATAQRLAQIYQQQLAQIKIPVGQDSQDSQAMVAQARAQQAQITADARAQSAERINASQAESEERIQQARAASAQIIEEEKRQTAAMQAEIKEREQAQRQSQVNSSSFAQNAASFAGAAIGGPIGGLVGAAVGGNPFMAAGLAVNEGARFLTDANQVAVAYNRQNLAALQLAGTQDKLNQLMAVYDRDTGNIIPKAQEVADITKLESLGFANNAKQLDQFTRAARGISLAENAPVSEEDEQLATAIITRRAGSLRELGLNADEVKEKVAQLQQADKSLSDTQAYGQAVLDIAIQKFGKLADSTAGAGTGMERLSKAWADAKLAAGQSDWFNQSTSGLADMLNFASNPQTRQDSSLQYNIRSQRQDLQSNALGMNPDELAHQTSNLQKFADAVKLQDELTKQGAVGARDYASSLGEIGDEMGRSGRLSDAYLLELAYIKARLEDLANSSDKAAAGISGASDAVRDFISAGEDALNSGAMNGILAMVSAGSLSPDQAKAAIQKYQSTNAAQASQLTSSGQTTQTGAAIAQAVTQGVEQAQIQGSAQIVSSVTSQLGDLLRQGLIVPDQYQQVLLSAQNIASDFLQKAQGGNLSGTALQVSQIQAEQQALAPGQKVSDADTAAKKAIHDGEAAQKKAANQWEETGKKAQRDFEAAAKKMADTFESKLGRVPGLLGTSEVTAEDMAASQAGVYKAHADEWLRQLNAAAQGSKDFKNFDWADAASRVGMADPGRDEKARKAVAAEVTAQWQSGAFFANRANLDKVNWGAVAGDVNQQRLGELGQRNLLDYAGLSPNIVAAAGYSGILPGRLLTPMDQPAILPGQAAGASMMTQGVGAVNPQDYAQMSNDAVAPIQDGLVAAVKTMGGVAGTSLADAMFQGFSDRAKQLDWVTKLTGVIADQVERDVLKNLTQGVTSDLAASEAVSTQR